MNKYRIGTDVPFQLSVDDGVEYLDLSTCTILKVAMYCDAQEAFAGSCTWKLNAADHTRLDCVYPGDRQVYTGIMRAVVVMEDADGEKKTYDLKGIFEIVATTEEANATGDTVTSATLSAWQLPMSTLSTIVEAAINATEAATESAIAEISYTESAEDDGINVLHIKQADGNEQDFNIKNGSRGATGAQGATGATGATGPQGPQGNPGSSQDYPFELENNLEDGSTNKALTGAMGAQLEGEITELELKVGDLVDGGTASKQVYDHSTFAAASVELPSTITLSQVGDFVEFKVKTANENTNIVRNTASYTAPYIGYTGATTFSMRLIGMSGSPFSYQGNYISRGSEQVFKLVLTSITEGTKNFTLFVDGTERTTATPPTAASDVTFAYAGQMNGANMDLYYIKGKSNGTDFYFDKFGEDTNVTGTVTDVYNTEQTTILGLAKDEQDIATLQSKMTDAEEGLEDVSQGLSDLDEKTIEGGSNSEYVSSSFSDNARNIPATIGMSLVGDFIEIKANIKTGLQALQQILVRDADTYNRRWIGHSATNTLFVRLSLSATPLAYQNAAVKENAVQVIRVELESITEGTYNFDVYLDGTKVGSTTNSNAVTFDTIGRYSTMDIYYIKNKSAGVETLYTKFAEMTDATDVTDNYVTTTFDGLLPLNERVQSLESSVASQIGEDMYYRFVKNSSVWQMVSHFEIYQRLKDNYYILTVVGFYTMTSDTYPKGYWRVERTNLVTIIDGVVTNIETQIITNGENEFVLQWLAGADYNASGGFTGGYHMGEKIDGVTGAWVEFIADGNKIGTSADIPLTPCKSFFYREYSAIYNCHDNPATVAAWHLKETTFKDVGYETMNDVKFVQALDYFAYPGIVCVSRFLSEYAMPEGVPTITDMGDGSTTIANQFKDNGNRIHYEGNGYMCDVDSEVLIGANDAQCERWVWNGSQYNKFYRRNPDTVGSTSNRLKGRTKVKISAM